MAQTGSDLIKRASLIQDDDSWNIVSVKNKATLTGGLIGMAAGVYWGHAKRHNLLVTGLFGGIVGALISKLFMPK